MFNSWKRRVRVYSFSHLWDFSLHRWAVYPDMHKTVLKLYNFVNIMATLLPLQICMLAAQVLSQYVVCRPCCNQDHTLLDYGVINRILASFKGTEIWSIKMAVFTKKHIDLPHGKLKPNIIKIIVLRLRWIDRVIFLEGKEKSLQVREDIIKALPKSSSQRSAPQEKVAVGEQATELVNNWVKFQWSHCAVCQAT